MCDGQDVARGAPVALQAGQLGSVHVPTAWLIDSLQCCLSYWGKTTIRRANQRRNGRGEECHDPSLLCVQNNAMCNACGHRERVQHGRAGRRAALARPVLPTFAWLLACPSWSGRSGHVVSTMHSRQAVTSW